MNKVKLLLLSLIVTLSFSCTKVDGPVSEETRDLGAYTGIDIGCGIDASKGSNVSVVKNNKVWNSSTVSLDFSGGGNFEGDIDVKTIETLSLNFSCESNDSRFKWGFKC